MDTIGSCNKKQIKIIDENAFAWDTYYSFPFFLLFSRYLPLSWRNERKKSKDGFCWKSKKIRMKLIAIFL